MDWKKMKKRGKDEEYYNNFTWFKFLNLDNIKLIV